MAQECFVQKHNDQSIFSIDESGRQVFRRSMIFITLSLSFCFFFFFFPSSSGHPTRAPSMLVVSTAAIACPESDRTIFKVRCSSRCRVQTSEPIRGRSPNEELRRCFLHLREQGVEVAPALFEQGSVAQSVAQQTSPPTHQTFLQQEQEERRSAIAEPLRRPQAEIQGPQQERAANSSSRAHSSPQRSSSSSTASSELEPERRGSSGGSRIGELSAEPHHSGAASVESNKSSKGAWPAELSGSWFKPTEFASSIGA
jgi:hypothetical protein